MSFEPIAPTVRVAPELIAPDTYQIHQVQTGDPMSVYINSLVITGAEPVIVDTGTVANRRQWIDDVFGIVEPSDVKWVFLSHDDHDHTGNLGEVLSACENATLVASWPIVERLTNAFDFPLTRMRWVNDGERIDAGDRTLHAVRPPLWDSPTTRGLLDARSGVYWAVDTFACPMIGEPLHDVNEFDPIFWRDAVTMGAYHLLSPWLNLVDPAKYSEYVDRIQVMGMHTIASAHSPVMRRDTMREGFDLLRELPTLTPAAVPGQDVLEEMLGATSVRG